MDFRQYQAVENLLLFKTNIHSKQDLKLVKKTFAPHQSIKSWWVDIEDCDKVLRIELSRTINEQHIIDILQTIGYKCETLKESCTS